THGKTTTTALLAWIMEKAGRKPGYLIGGLPTNFGQGARLNDSKYFVIEGDEYDTAFFDKRSKFIHYLPELVIVNNIEFDHADIFNNIDEIKLSFKRLLNIVPQNGMVLLNGDDHNCVEVAKDCLAQMVEVGFSKNCAQRIRDVAYSPEGSRFQLGDDVYEIPLVGEFNVRNAPMAATAARFYDVPKAKVVFIAQVARLEQIPEAERLHPDEMVKEISEGGRPAFYEKNADAIVDRIVPLLKREDVVVVFSNGGFDNIHEKLLARLKT